MSSIYDKITVRLLDKPGKKKFTISKIQFLRMYSEIARNETDKEIQEFFNAFNI